MEHKTGFYISEACLGDALDFDELEDVAKSEYNVALCRRVENIFNEEAYETIKKDVEDGVNTIVIAGSSPREALPNLNFPGCIVERINLREAVVWSHDQSVLEDEFEEEDADENILAMAKDYVRMGLVKAQKSEIPEPMIIEDLTRKVLVIGGGVAGMNAALNVAKAGVEVTLVEKHEELGGWAKNLHHRLPAGGPYVGFQPADVTELIEKVNSQGKINIVKGTEVKSVSGMPGAFNIELSNGQTDKVGSIIVAAGWKPFDTAKFDEKYAYGSNPNVITSLQLEEMIKKDGKITRPSDGGDVTAIAFVTNVDTKEGSQAAYLGNVADMVALKQAHYLVEQTPGSVPYLIHDHVKSPGLYENLFRDVQKKGLVLIRGDIDALGEGSERPVMIEGSDLLLNEKIMMEVDLVVLSVGMTPVTVDEEVLHLNYRQGPELPELSNGYANSHFICFPYETRRTGIYTCGSVREPMEMGRAADDAAGAAMKAVQAIELTSQGKANFPRVGDLSLPEFNMKRCTQCKRCTEECPFGAIDEDEKGNPIPNLTRCRRCGTCMGACPERIISFKNYSVDMIGGMLKAVEVPDEFEEKPRILMFVCENDALPALDMAGLNRLNYSSYVRVITLRCLGSMNLVWIADAMSAGYDGVMLLGCKHGEDYQCHFVKGSELCNTRMEKVSETLDRLMLESDRIRFKEINITDYKEVPGMINQFVEDLKELGPNPYKP